jgi:hypothetical protein
MHITSKAEFFRLWNAGVLGFKLRTWDDPKEAVASGAPIIGLRQIGKAGGGRLDIVPREELIAMAAEWTAAGLKFMCCEAAPDEHGTIQGEVCRTYRGLEGLLGFSNGLRMRDAIARGLLVPRSPAATFVLLRDYMSAASRDDLDGLLELYPDATVEFTCYGEHDFGRGRNAIFWEVRDY